MILRDDRHGEARKNPEAATMAVPVTLGDEVTLGTCVAAYDVAPGIGPKGLDRL
jgi:hypothetical protein